MKQIIYLYILLNIIHFGGADNSDIETNEKFSIANIFYNAILSPKVGLFVPGAFLDAIRICDLDTLPPRADSFPENETSADFENSCFLRFSKPLFRKLSSDAAVAELCENKVFWERCVKSGLLSWVNQCLESKHIRKSSSYKDINWKFIQEYNKYFCADREKFISEYVSDMDPLQKLVCTTSDNEPMIWKCIQERDDMKNGNLNRNAEQEDDMCRNYGIVKNCINKTIAKCNRRNQTSQLLEVMSQRLKCTNGAGQTSLSYFLTSSMIIIVKELLI